MAQSLLFGHPNILRTILDLREGSYVLGRPASPRY